MLADTNAALQAGPKPAKLEITPEEVMSHATGAPDERRATLELVRDMARACGLLTQEQAESLRAHYAYRALNIRDRAAVEEALDGPFKAPLKTLATYMLMAHSSNKARRKMNKTMGWHGMGSRAAAVLGHMSAKQRAGIADSR
jgi:hypothetical protein